MIRVNQFIIFSLILGLSGCDKAGNTHTANTQNKSPAWLKLCPDFSVTGKAPVTGNAECGSFETLENPSDPAGAKINLNVLRVPSINPVPQPDPLFIIAGGPGQSAVDLAIYIAPLFSDVRKNRDLIFVDQRGTGRSGPFECPSLEMQADEKYAIDETVFLETAVKPCAEKYGNRLAFYTTPFAARDLDEVRKQLGYTHINLWGASYGTRVALQYMTEFPEQTRAVVLDGVAPYEIALPIHMDEDARTSLSALNAQCAATPECKSEFGDLQMKAQQVATKLQQAPLHIELRHPRTQKKEMTKIDGDDFSGLIRHMLYDRDLSTLIPQIISDTAQSDYQLLGSQLFLAKSKTDLTGINQAMHFAVVCNEDFPQYTAQLTKELQLPNSVPFLNSRAMKEYASICQYFSKTSSAPAVTMPSRSTPTLILSGAQDPVTPPRWAEKVSAKLPNAVSLVAPGGHHGISMQGCGSQLIALFIERGTAKNLETKCIQSIKPLAIHLPPQAMSSTQSSNLPELNNVKKSAANQSSSARSEGANHD